MASAAINPGTVSALGAALQELPPKVATLRTCMLETLEAPREIISKAPVSNSEDAISRKVFMAPISILPSESRLNHFNSSQAPRLMMAFFLRSRDVSLGTRSVPPARREASGP